MPCLYDPDILVEVKMSQKINPDEFQNILLSEQMAEAVADSLVELLRGDDLPEELCGFLPEGAVSRLEEELCVRIQVAICKAGLPMVFAQKGGEIAAGAMTNSAIGKAVARKIVGIVTKPMARDLEEYIIDDGHDIILGLMDKELQYIANSPVSELSNIFTTDDSELKALIKLLYLMFMKNYARPIAEKICSGAAL